MEKLRLWLYYFKHAFGSILANRLVYFVSTVTLSISLLLFGAFVLISANFINWVQGWERSLSLSVYLEDVQGVLGAGVTLTVLFMGYSLFTVRTIRFFGLPGMDIIFLNGGQYALIVLLGLVLGLAGSFLAIGRFFKFREKEKKLLQRLTDLEKEIEEQRRSLRELEESAVRIKKELVEGEGRLSELENALADLETRLGRRLDAFYRYAKRGYARLFTSAGGLDALRKGIKYLKAIMKDDLALMQKMAGFQQQYRQEVTGVRDQIAGLERLEKTESTRMAELKEDIDRRVVLLMKIHKEKEFYNTAVKELELAAQNLQTTLLGLEKEGKTKQVPLPAGFEASQGKLLPPLEGKIIRDTGPNGPKGILIEALPGGEVKAVYSGRVDFSGPLKGYGQVIVINHGGRYFTVSAQLGKRAKETGENVEAGDVIGVLAESSRLQVGRLYFEIRMGVETIDPLKWLKVH
jgi:murein hydrolase activator